MNAVEPERPVFVVGLPRSGTSMVEQILASHPRVFGAGELNLVRESFEAIPGVTGHVPSPIDGVPLLANTDDDGYMFVNNQLVSMYPGGHGAGGGAQNTPITLQPGTYDFMFFPLICRSKPSGSRMWKLSSVSGRYVIGCSPPRWPRSASL